MEIRSRAWRTDLALLEASGSLVEHHEAHVVVRTPDNPTYRWGNFLLLQQAPADSRGVDRWVEAFDEVVRGSGHVAFGVDEPAGEEAALAPLAERGFDLDVSAVMTADALERPTTTPEAEIRPLRTDADWAQRVDLAVACEETGVPGFAEFVARKAASERRLAESGLGDWFGAFVEGRMVAGLGIFRAGEGLARYQDVETHPAHRRRGLAGALVLAAGEHALNALGSATLVIVADPSYHAYRLYERLGFRRTESQLQAELIR